jgi:hypothetical protein
MTLPSDAIETSFYPVLKPIISPGTNPKAAMGNPEAAVVEECVANCDAVLLMVCITCLLLLT